jgi:hypothetical protein
MIMTMKNKFLISLLTIISVGACTYDFPEQALPTAGSANFGKYVAIGSSFTAGFANGALYTAAQQASFPAILATQMELVGGGEFNQPDINAANGCYNPANCAAAGRLILKGLASPKPTPVTPGDPITAYSGDKAKLNNFGAYGISIQLSLAAATSGPASGANPYYNPYFARFAATPSVNGISGSSMISDATAAMTNGGTFFTFQLGADDVLAYALNGADQADPTRPLTPTANFTSAYSLALSTILGANASANGAVINIPDITSLPHFSLVPYNAIPLDAGTASVLTSQLANNYNAFLDGMAANMIITTDEAAKRKLTYKAGQNAILIKDETLTDLTPYMAGPYAGLLPYAIARQTASTDLIPLGTSAILGTPGSFGVLGVSEPIADKYVLIPSEITQIQASTDAFNAHIKSQVDAAGARLVLVDLNKILKDLKTAPVLINGSSLTASISPPFGAYSTDGIHPNSRGYAYLANKMIEVINGKWKSSIGFCNPNDFVGNELPVP